MMLAILTTALFLTGGQNNSAPQCIDPATPIRILAVSHLQWPPTPSGKLAAEAKARLDTYLRTGRDRDYREALHRYENLQQDMPSDPHVRMALAVLYASGPDLNFKLSEGYRHVAILSFSNADARAERNMQWLLDRDSTQWIAAVELTRNALVSPEKGKIADALSALRRALSADPANVALNLAWYDLLVRQQKNAEALEYIRAHGGNCTGQQQALAEAMMLNGDTATGSRLYLRTLDNAKSDELDRFSDDARVMMTVAQVRAYRAVPEAQRAKWLRAFWDRTAAASGRTIETRVSEQTVRSIWADANHRADYFQGRRALERLAVISDTSHVVPWDALGVYYVRHGPPDRLYVVGGMSDGYQGWAYTQMQPPVIVLAVKTRIPPTDWHPIEYPPCTSSGFLGRFDPKVADAHISQSNNLTMREMYYALSDIDPRYGELVKECALVVLGVHRIRYDELVVDFTHENRKLLPRLANTESSLPHITKPVRLAVDYYQFRTPSKQPEVVALSWVPMADLHNATANAEQLRLTYSVVDSLTGSMRSDTTVALPRGTTSGLVRVPVTWRSPSVTDGTLRVTVLDPADTLRGATKVAPFRVRSDTASVSLSDIVLADAGNNGPLVRGARHIAPIPDHKIKGSDEFRVIAELYGVPNGQEVETTVHVHRETDKQSVKEQLHLVNTKEERTISFKQNVALDDRGVGFFDVDVTGDLMRGTYTVDLIVKSGNTTTTRSTTLVVE